MAIGKPGLPTIARAGTRLNVTSKTASSATAYYWRYRYKTATGEYGAWSSDEYPYGRMDENRRSYVTFIPAGGALQAQTRGVILDNFGFVWEYGPRSDVATFTMPSVPNAPPGNVTISRRSATSVTVAWDLPWDGGSPLTGYDIELRDSGGFLVQAESNSSARTRAFLDLNPGGTYYGRVRATNDMGAGDWKSSATLTLASPPSQITAVTLTRAGTASWAAPADGGSPITGYEAQVWDGFVWGPVVTVGRSMTIAENIPGIGYKVRARARNVAGASDWRESAAVTRSRCTCVA